MAKNNNYKNYKSKKNTGLKVISVMLAGLTAAAGVACGIGWAKAVKLEKQVNALIQERDENAEIIPMSLSTYGIVEEDYEKYGIPARATNSKLIVADFTPTNTTDTRCRWTWKWKDGSTTEPVEDYVYFNPEANNGSSCAVGCLQPFRKTILLTCTSVADSKITSTTKIEYVARYDSICNENDYVMEHFQDAINVFQGFYISDEEYEGTVIPDSFEADVEITVDNDLFELIFEENSDAAESIYYKNIKGAIPYMTDEVVGSNMKYDYDMYGWRDELTAFSSSYVAQYCVDNDTNHIGYISVRIRCYYKGEFIYEFIDERDWVLSAGCLAEIKTPPQGLNTPPEVAL